MYSNTRQRSTLAASSDNVRLAIASTAQMLGHYASQIAHAPDPMAKLQELRPRITHPAVDGGAVPWLLTVIAMGAVNATAAGVERARASLGQYAAKN